jgi:isohexenylglutaconyl-CoA hydratase
MTDLVHLEHTGGAVATITLNRPEARNALSLDLIAALRAGVARVREMREVHVLVLTGAGKAFCAGMDLKAVLDDPDAPGQLLHALAELTHELRHLPAVTVARVNGAAIGGGCGLTCVCDIAVTHADAKLGYPEVGLGVCPAVVAPWLVQRIGAGRARRVLLTGGLMTGAEAHALGMVDHVAQDLAGLDELCASVVERLAAGGPHALRATKALLNELEGAAVSREILAKAAELSAAVVRMPETRQTLLAKLGR